MKTNKTENFRENSIFAAKIIKHMVRTDYYQEYEKKLKMLLLHFCTSKQWLGKQLLEVEELDAKWEEMAPEMYYKGYKHGEVVVNGVFISL